MGNYFKNAESGLIATLLNEVMVQWLWLQGILAMTAGTAIRLSLPVPINVPLALESYKTGGNSTYRKNLTNNTPVKNRIEVSPRQSTTRDTVSTQSGVCSSWEYRLLAITSTSLNDNAGFFSGENRGYLHYISNDNIKSSCMFFHFLHVHF